MYTALCKKCIIIIYIHEKVDCFMLHLHLM